MLFISKPIYHLNLFIFRLILTMVLLIKISPYKLLVEKFVYIFILNFFFYFLGSVPISCTIDFGDGHRQTNGTSRHQYYTAYFARNYTRYGEYNISIRCSNELSVNTTQIIRIIRRDKMNKKMIIFKDLMETTTATRFNLISHDDYSFRHSSCLCLRNPITNETMKLIWRKKTLEVIPNEVSRGKFN
jgi:hypothetical protein